MNQCLLRNQLWACVKDYTGRSFVQMSCAEPPQRNDGYYYYYVHKKNILLTNSSKRVIKTKKFKEKDSSKDIFVVVLFV